MEPDLLNQIPDQIHALAQNIEGPLANAALELLGLLFTIQLLWGICDLLLSRASLPEALAWFMRQIITISFFAGVIRNWGNLSNQVITAFSNTASQASGFNVTLTPSNILVTGLNLSSSLFNLASLWDATTWVVMLLALVILGAFVVMALVTAIVLAEIYLVTAGSVVFLGLSGTGWTMPMAQAQFRYLLGAAAKVFTLIFLLGMFNQLAVQWSDQFQAQQGSFSDTVVAATLSAFAAGMIIALPSLVQSFVSGVSLGFGGSVAAAGMFAAGGIGRLASAVSSGVSSAIGGSRLAQAALQSASSAGAGRAPITRQAMIASRALLTAGGEMAQVMADKKSGRVPQSASVLWRSGENIRNDMLENDVSTKLALSRRR